jgi:hypothetical protein
MPDNASTPSTLSPEANYATRRNILYPGSASAATAAATRADARIEQDLPAGTTVAGLTITANNEP